MKRFQDRIYARSQKGLLLWEPSWETFRPVEAVVWNPIHTQLEPYFGIYTHDIFDMNYGYGTPELHEFCIEFTDDNAHDIDNAEDITDTDIFWRWSGTTLRWVNDRALAVHPCAGDPERKKYLARFNLKPKTCKHPPRNLKGTRKVHTHQ